ncbi:MULTISPECIES: hypothetical protein [unclassified Isoptericola]|uniref:hypothetical protein n=1 Tax=unclassified Isoptericola TaxID=2623355 RepID=UPI002712C1B1|nr:MULTISPECIES: hypothetical protein [unclassified Isoptericola]MDO8144914.1 hypothetical protein [Isoptericola sp. 178]MDO8149693.1 hypothetical protein [Isoptericola sp. b515]MDO8152628.1 hypothetical protein [Isoptericola sp. b408]
MPSVAADRLVSADRPVTRAATLALWELLSATAPPARGAAVLVARGLAPDLGAACDVPLAVAARAALADLRDRVGPVLDTVLTCPACEALLDVPLPLDDVLADADVTPSAVRVGAVEVRGPTTADVLAALDAPDPAATLRRRCVSWPAGTGPDDDADLAVRVAATAERLAGAAGASVRLGCPECGEDVLADVDVVRLLTDRVTDQARATLAEVATLCGAFGWSEHDVLELSPARFDAYLDLARTRV